MKRGEYTRSMGLRRSHRPAIIRDKPPLDPPDPDCPCDDGEACPVHGCAVCGRRDHGAADCPRAEEQAA